MNSEYEDVTTVIINKIIDIVDQTCVKITIQTSSVYRKKFAAAALPGF